MSGDKDTSGITWVDRVSLKSDSYACRGKEAAVQFAIKNWSQETDTRSGTAFGTGHKVHPQALLLTLVLLFGELLCISHGESSSDDKGRPVTIRAGMKLTAFDGDPNDEGHRDSLIASGIVVPAPDWLRCTGSRWVPKIDENRVKHESDL